MRFLPQQREGRREFLRDAARYSVLGLLALIAALSAKVVGATRRRCINRSICSRCAVFADCELPAALSRKQSQNG